MGELFYCEHYRCKLSPEACVRRQALRVKLYLKGRRSSSGTHCAFDLSPCNPAKCAQGRENVKRVKGKRGHA